MIISVDTGNKQMKSKHETFISGIMEDDSQPSVGGNADFMRMNGKYYILTNTRNTYMRDKTKSGRYYNLTVMAIVKELEHMLAEGSIEYDKSTCYQVTLLGGLPPAHYGELKKSYQAYFKQKGEPVKVVYKNHTWNFRVNRVAVFAQGFAAVAPIISEIKKYPKALVCDIGGLTADYIMLNYGVADMNITDSLERGVIILYQKIKKICQSKYGSIIEERDVDAILMGDKETVVIYPKDIVDTVNRMTQKFVDELLGSFREYQIDLKTTYVIFIGGGSLLLKRFIQNSRLLGNYRFIEDVNANVKGYEVLYNALQQRVKK